MKTAVLVNRANDKNRAKKSGWQDLLFVILLLIWPTAQFAVFYLGVNFNSFLMVFQKFDLSLDESHLVTTSWAAFLENWSWCQDFFSGQDFLSMLGMSTLNWAAGVIIGTPLGLLFSYYIAKKMPASGFFRVVLYLPSIISALILVLLYMNFMDFPFAETILNSMSGVTGPRNPLWVRESVVIFFNIWSGFGTSVLMYANAMSAISPEILEAASIDGAKGIREFRSIVFPLVFPTFKVFFVTSLATIFTEQFSLYSFYGPNCPTDMQTLGYYLFNSLRNEGYTFYPKLALLGIVFSFIAIPLTFLVRFLLNKYGPSED